MNPVVSSIVGLVAMLGIMILVHEWGHFVAARLFGVRVEVFSIGFGPRLWGRRRGATDYRISALPLGGYVKMAGDNPTEERTGAPDEFLSKPRWQRTIVILAGPAMNLISAVVLVTGLNMVGARVPLFVDEPAVIGHVAPDWEAARLGLRTGDRVAQIRDLTNPTWEQVLFEIAASTGRDTDVIIDRDGQLLPVVLPTARLKSDDNPYRLTGMPYERIIVHTVAAGMPAAAAGLRPGDQILRVNGEEVTSTEEFRRRVQALRGGQLDLCILRNGREQAVSLRPQRVAGGGWQIGVTFQFKTKVYPFPEAFARAVSWNVRLTETILSVVGRLVQGKVSLKQLEGPLRIAQQSGEAARQGLMEFIQLMAMISLNLGILNLLPIPILDGGHILMLAIEGLLRRELSVRFKERFVQVGLVFLLVVFAIVMYNDVLKLLPR